MIAGNLYTKLQDAGTTFKKTFNMKTVFFTCMLFVLFNNSFAATGFDGGSPQNLGVCQNSSLNSINSLLTASGGTGTYTWTIVTNPTHGSLGGFPFSTAAGTSISPSGTTYNPTGGYTGTDLFVIQVSDGTTSANTIISVTVNPVPGAIFVPGAICVGNTMTVASGTTGGTYSSSNIALATVVAGTGVVTGVGAGNPTITYTLGTGCMATATITVNPTPNAISGSNLVCTGNTTALSESTSGGTWSSSNTLVATVGSTGVVTGVTAGNPTISYTLPAGCFATLPMTVNTTPPANTGPTAVCTGLNITLANGTGGGLWTSSNATLASVVAGSGVVTGNSAGFPTITYTVPNGCFVTSPITVNTNPSAISGANNVCVASSTTLSDASSGGVWTSSNTLLATVGSATGVVTGVSAGLPTITYTTANACFVTQAMTINPNPSAITGTFTVCTGLNTTLSNLTSGGAWTSSNATVASVGAGTGIVTGNTAGVANITYTMGTSCFVTQSVTVNTTPSANTGSSTVCIGQPTTLSNSTGGGLWSSNNSSVATVGSTTGVVNGIAAGNANISYIISATGCFAVTTMTVNNNPAAITGSFTVCTGTTTTLANATAGGTWSSSNATLASVVAGTGVVTGVATGTPNITYTLATGCFATQNITVNPSPSAIAGPTAVCTGASITLSDVTGGGTWSSSSIGLATVGSATGIVNGLTAGVVTISYTIPNGCFATQAVTVNGSPAGISGSSTVCTGAQTTLIDATLGGTWSSSDATKATIVAGTGVVTGVAAGTVTMTYTLATGCFSVFAMTVNPTPGANTGTANVCVGSTTTLSNASGPGTWTSSNTSLATVGSASGIVTGVTIGVPTITYSLTATGCFVTTAVTVNPNPVAISGSPVVCVGSTVTLTDATLGGLWTSSNAGLASIGAGTGNMTGVSTGNPIITYTLPTGCFTTVTATVNPLPNAITGTTNVCIGFTTTLSDATPGGTWTSSNTSTATVGSATGIVSGVAQGVATMTYTLPTGCFVTTSYTVNPNPAAITGTTNVCIGATTTLFDATSGGTWSSSNISLATVNASSGTVTGVSSGSLTITYTLPTGCFITTPFTVNSNPNAITGTTNVCVGLTTTLANATPGGTWSSSNTAQGTVGAGTGVVGGISAGTPIITYLIPATGCFATTAVTVNPNPSAIGGTGIVCTGSTTTLTSSPSGGLWSSSNIAQGSINAGSGVMAGITVGNPTITYTLPTGCLITKVATINQTPVAIAGTTSVCVGFTTTLTDATAGGVWSSSNTAQGTVGAGTGVVGGISAGIPVISYVIASTGCFAVTNVTVNPNPAGITGATAVCTGSTIGLADATTGGLWSSSDATKATIGSTSGVVTGVAAGTPTISYILNTGCYATYPITVNTTPNVITGTTSVCTGFTTTLANATTGGTWSSSNTAIGTVGAGTGIVGGITAGNVTISYTMGTGCFVTTTVTVNQNPPASTGSNTVCVGLTTVLSNTLAGGVWSSSNTAQATVGSTTGIVNGIAIGSPNITYAMPTGCFVTTNITVNPTPAAITGPTVVCAGSPITLSDATSGGVWSSGNTLIATVNPGTGVVTGVAAGTVAITYTLGAGCFATYTITVNPVPNISNFTSTTATSPCIGASSTVTISSNTIGTGTYTVTYNLSGANAATGATATLTMGTTTGTFVIPSASLTSSGFTTVTVTGITNSFGCVSFPITNNASTFSVNPLPTIYNVLGGGSYCAGGTGVHIFLSNSVGGVNYQLMLGATPVGAPVAGTFAGLDFGLITTVGTYTVTATNATTGCTNSMSGSATVSTTPVPNVFTLTGGGSYCSGGTGVAVGLSGSNAGINYQLYIGGVATGSPLAGTGSAITFGLQTTAGVYTVVATDATTACTSNMTGSSTVVINPLPAAISGTLTVCPGTTTTLTDATSGGTWSSSTPSIATVGSSTGVVTGVLAGTAVVSYILGTGCQTTTVVTVNPNPATIGGPSSVCVTSTITLTNSTGGGTWSSSNTSLATINVSSGIVTGVAAGTPVMTYALATGCFSVFPITVNPTPASIAGTTNACIGASSTLTDATSGGTWTSSNPGIAGVGSATGIVTGVTAGTATITYTLPAGCNTTTSFTVNPIPSAITGATNVCVGGSTTLANAASGGSWSSSNTSIATINAVSGLVIGGAAGTVTMTYTLPAGCFTTTSFTVNPTPASITGTNNVCVGLTTTLVDATTGGTWTSSNGAIATIGASTGTVTGVTAGTATITYTLPAGCNVTFAITVNPNPSAIAGVTNVCVGSTTSLTDPTTGGTWTSSNTTLATIGSSTGVVNGLSAGVVTITYTLGTGCIATAPLTVNPLPSAITGVTTVCVGLNTNLADASTGGTWSSSNIAIAIVGSGSGTVTGQSAGNATITYTLPTGCLVTTGVTVNPSPATISGAAFVCVGQTTTLSDATTGGVWSSSNTSLATVVPSTGVVTGVAVGNPFITYTLPAGCFTTMLISVNPMPNAITGTFTVCEGATTTLANTVGGGTWTSANPAIGSISPSTGVLTGVSAGTVVITYTLPGGCFVVATATVNPSPSAIGGLNNVCFGLTTPLTNSVSGGLWTSSASGVASVGSVSGIVTGVTVGPAVITYTLPAGCFTTLVFTVNPLPATIGGFTQVCVGSTTTLTDATSGGSWSSSNTSIATVVSGTGVVTGVAAGTVTITYTLPTGCITTTSLIVNPLPTIFTMTGGGTYCAGGSGVAVGLSGSQVGVNYQLIVGTTATGSPVAGSGSAITFGLQTTPGLYTVVATNATTGCQSNMTGASTVTVTVLPTVFNMTGGGSYCSGSTGVPVGLNGSQVGINYQLYLSGAPFGSFVAGTGSAISFGTLTGAGTYTVIATNSVTTCVSNMAGTAVIVINPLPTAFTVTGGGNFCVGGTGVTINLSSSTVGVNYTCTNGSVTSTIPGTGSPLVFGPFTSIGTYTISASNTTTGCVNNMLGSANITSSGLPTAFNLSPSPTASYCFGGTGVTISLSGSQNTFSYQLFMGTTPMGAAVTGTGSPISFAPQTAAGTYTCVATNPITGCFNTMNLSTTLTINPLPVVQTVTGGGAYCVGGAGVPIGVAATVIGTSYQLFRVGTVTPLATIAGTGLPINFANQTVAGTYNVVATVVGTSCTVPMSGSVIVSISPLPTLYSVTGGGNYCSGGTGLPIGLTLSDVGINYQLVLSGTNIGSPVAGTGAAISFGTFTTAGTYTVVATNPLTSCTATMSSSATIIVNPLPALFNLTGGGSYCAGGTGVTVGLSGSVVGTSYQLLLAGLPVGIPQLGTGSPLVFGPVTGAGIYTINATIIATGCVRSMTGTSVVAINPVPAVNIVVGGGSYCAGGAGVHVGLNGSVSGINYQVYVGGVMTGSPMAGTGSALDFGSFTTAGIYTVVATNPITLCTSNMTGSVVISINPLPVVYNITGGGGYCAGGAGSVIGLSGSDTGVSYQLFNGASPSGVAVAGTGSAISFGPQSIVGTYTIVATKNITGCSSTMSGSVIVNINPLPSVFTVTGGGQYCPGGSGVNIGLSNSTTGVNYQLYLAGSPVGAPVPGLTGLAISFGLKTGLGTYTVVAIDGTTACTSNMTGTALVSLYTLPTTFNVTGGGGYCLGTTGSNVMLSGSTTGVNYQLYMGVTAIGVPMIGTGSSLNFGPQTGVGNYTVVGTSLVSGCSNNMTGSVTVSVNPLPTAWAVTGGGGYCAGGAGVPVGLANSGTGISYQLFRAGLPVGSPLAGTGSAISFGTFTTAGNYTVVATNITTGCVNNMTGSASVIVNSLPVVYTVSGGGNYCSGGTGVHVGLSVSDAGISYQLWSGSTMVGVPVAGSGSPLDFGLITAAGTYSVTATNSVTGCMNNMAASATVVINPLPGLFTVTGGGSYCAGGVGQHVGLSGSASGINYQLYKDGVIAGPSVAGTGASLDFGLQTAAGVYTVVATNATTGCTNNMTLSATIVINPLPVIDTVTGGGNYCPGGSGVHIGLTSSTSGINYQLFRGTTSIGLPVAGTGSGLDFGLQTITGTYFVTATNPATMCSSNMLGSASVNISALPTAYTVSTGVGSYCAGGIGLNVTQSGSSVGTSYQLYWGSAPTGTPVAGTGFPLNFGLFTNAGVYTVVATDGTTGCVNNMTGAPTITINPLPTVNTVTGGGSYCAGGTGLGIALGGSEVGVNYQLYNGSVASGAAMAGTGYSLNFGLRTAAGTYTVVASNATTGCTSNMLSSASINVNPLPTVYYVVGGGSYCAGGTGVNIGVNNTVTGVNYQLYNGTTSVGSPVAGTGSNIVFGLQTATGTYTVVATNATTGCMSTMTGSAIVAINPLPTAFAVTGGGNYCTGGAGHHVGLSGSTVGISYQLEIGGTPVGSALIGTGFALDFGLITTAGTYTVEATNSATGCFDMMTGSAVITVSPLPVQYPVLGGGSYCASLAGANVDLGNSEIGVSYQLYNGSGPVGGALPGTGAALHFGLQPAGTYTVVGMNTATTCSSNMLGSATVTVIPSVVPAVTINTGVGSTVCAGTLVNYTALAVNGGGTPTYQWYINGVPAGTGSSYSFVPTNGNIVSVTMTSNATCVSPATASNNVTMTVVDNVTPSVSISSSPSGAVCQGTVVLFTPSPVWGGTAPVFTWYVNGRNMGVGSTYSYAPNDGDVVFGTMNSSFACVSTTSAAISNNMTMSVEHSYTPVITLMTVNPGTPVGGEVHYSTYNFRREVDSKGRPSSGIMWNVNGVPVAGATDSVFTAPLLYDGDVVSVVVNVTNSCGIQSGTDSVMVHSANVAVHTVTASVSDIKLVPNPNKGIFTLKGTLGTNADQEVTVEVTDVIGQVIYSGKVMAHGGNVDGTIQLSNNVANGMYIVNLRAGSENKVFHMVIEQ